MQLTNEEARVLGCLVEKQMTTPDVYPMTLNGLVTACNQTTNREPIVAYDSRTVTEALDGLRTDHKLVRIVHSGAGSRVDKFKHVLDERLALVPKESALLAVLLLRGPQTLGELKMRTERYVGFDTLEQVDTILDRLCDPTIAVDPAEFPVRSDAGLLASASSTARPDDDRPIDYRRPWHGPLVVRIPRQPGQKEPRVAHLLLGPIDLEALARNDAHRASAEMTGGGSGGSWREKCGELETQIVQLREELESIRAAFAEFKSQF
jgi:uncharacterized protein